MKPVTDTAAQSPDSGQGSFIWQPRGGNNPDNLGGNCHIYTFTDAKGVQTRMMMDLGLMWHDTGTKTPEGRKNIINVLPDVTDVLPKRGEDAKPGQVTSVFVTHGHDDHYGGIAPYIQNGYDIRNVYSTPTTQRFLVDDLTKHGIPRDQWPKLHTIHPKDSIKVADGVTVDAVGVTHSIPGSLAFHIQTPAASVFHSGDFKADDTVVLGQGTNFDHLAAIKAKGGVDAAITDATGAGDPGEVNPEANVGRQFKALIAENPGKRMVAAVPGHFLQRMGTLAQVAADCQRTLVYEKAGLAQAMRALKQVGLDLSQQVPGLRVLASDSPEAKALDPAKTLYLVSGARGEHTGGLYMAAHGRHEDLTLGAHDVVAISANYKRGADRKLVEMAAPMMKKGVAVFSTTSHPDLEAGGHGYAGDITRVLQSVGAKVGLPTHCNPAIDQNFKNLMAKIGMDTPPSLIQNGYEMQISAAGVRPLSMNVRYFKDMKLQNPMPPVVPKETKQKPAQPKKKTKLSTWAALSSLDAMKKGNQS